MNQNDPPEIETSGTTRRRFLGAAAALAGFTGFTGSSTATSNQPDIDIKHDEWGAARATLPKRSGLSSHLELYNLNENDVKFRVKAYRYDDEESHVSVSIMLKRGNVSMTLSAEEARTIAADLEAAADVVEGQHGD